MSNFRDIFPANVSNSRDSFSNGFSHQMLDFGPTWLAKVPVFGLQVCNALLRLVVDVIVGDREEVPPPEVAGKEAVVAGHPVLIG